MKITFLTLFPEMFENFTQTSIIKRAISNDAVNVEVDDIRKYTTHKNGRVDDYTIGGGAGLIMQCQPALDCIAAHKNKKSKVIYLSPRGHVFTQQKAQELAKETDLIFLCGHYEGIDERIIAQVDEHISIGDYILTGGELPSMVVADSIIRLLDGAISHDSLNEESFSNGLLEYPQYTFPRIYNNIEVPAILFCGDHEAVRKWRLKESIRQTLKYRPDLLEYRKFSKEEQSLFDEIANGNDQPEWLIKALEKGKKFL